MLQNAVAKLTPAYLSAAEDLRENAGQWKAYESTGNCAVLAGPGSGKTKTLTIKMARMLAEDVNEPRGIACITYNNECAQELRKRLGALGVREGRNVYIGTIHSFCYRHVILPYGRLAGLKLPRELGIASESEQTKFFQDAFAKVVSESANPDGWRTGFEKYRRTHLDRGHASWLGDDAEDAALIEKYEDLLHKNGLIDFEDMVLIGLRLIEGESWVRNCLRARFPILVVDEYQDLGLALHRIVLSLCFSSGIRLFAVGDPDQSIYGFAGAQPTLLRDVTQMAGVEKVQLQLNYRSGQNIIDAAEVALGETRGYKSNGGSTGAILFHKSPGGIDEQASDICTKLIPASLARKGAKSLGDIAVLYLDRHDGNVIEQHAKVAGFQYIRTDRGAAYRKTALIRWLEGCASWCADQSPSATRSLSALVAQWRYFNSSVRSEMDIHRSKVKLIAFLHAHNDPDEPLRDWLVDFDDRCLGETLSKEPSLRDEKGAVAGLSKLCAEGGQLEKVTVGAFGGQTGSKIHLNLITLHSAKGLEFDVVMMMGMDQGKIPRYKATAEDRAAARRLFYVGLTRARHEVHLAFSGFVENKFGRYDNGPSEFVIEVYKRLKSGK